jgi:hypothetical protein
MMTRLAVASKKTNRSPYTGFDGIAKGITPGLRILIRRIERETRKGLWNNGAYMVRDIKGQPRKPSVHATGRAVDLSWRDMPDDRGRPNYRHPAVRVVQTLIRNADEIGLEMVIDYFPHPYGRAWRCDRGRWRKYDSRTVSGAPGGDWFHIEISPDMAHDPEGMKTALAKAFAPNPPQA